MKSLSCRVDDDVEELLRSKAQEEGMTMYAYVGFALTKYAKEEREEDSKRAIFEAEMREQMKIQRFNVRYCGEVLMAMLAGQIGEEEASKTLREISAKLKQQGV